MIICEKCANFSNCECVPYDVECDNNFKEKVGVNDISDAQIIKALQKVKGHQIVTGNVCVETNTFDCVTVAQLIEIYNRQQADLEFAKKINALQMEELQKAQAEIEKLRKKNKTLVVENISLTHTLEREITKAIKEFAERLKVNYSKPLFAVGSYNEFIREVDNLVKEMVGENNV